VRESTPLGFCLPAHLAALYTAPHGIGNLSPPFGYLALLMQSTAAKILPL
jgi:hypothetical protein